MTWEIYSERQTTTVRIDGELMTFAQALRAHGAVSSTMVRARIKEGWDVEKAFKTPAALSWRTMSVRSRIELVRNYVTRGMVPETIAPLIDGIDAKTLAVFCGNHQISYGHKRLRKAERPAIVERRTPGREVDPKTRPSAYNPATGLGGVHFLETNSDTCRWPLFNISDPPEKRLCCGGQTKDGSVYCDDHWKKSGGGRG